MNRRISAFLTVLAMVLALSACGDGKKENGQTPQEQPKLEEVLPNHFVACHYVREINDL